MTRPFFAYMLLCADDTYYTGHTDELEQRIAKHDAGAIPGYTATRRPLRLVWSQDFPTREEALAAELRIKNWSRAKKEALIAGDYDGLRQAAKKEDWAAYRARKSGQQEAEKPPLAALSPQGANPVRPE